MSEIIEVVEEYVLPRHLIWDVLIDPQMYPRLFRGVGACVQVDLVNGQPVLDFHVGTPAVGMGSLRAHLTVGRRYEEFDLQCPRSGSLVSVRIRSEGARTTVKVILLGAGRVHPFIQRQGAGAVRKWIRRGLEQVASFVWWEPTSTLSGDRGGRAPRLRPMLARHVARSRPDIVVRQWAGLLRGRFDVVADFTAAAAHAPDRVAVIDDWGTVTYGELHQRARLLAAALAERGIGSGDTVALLARNHIEALQVIGATAALGADLVLLNTGMSAEHVAGLVESTGASILFVDGELEMMARAVDPRITMCSTDGRSLFPAWPTVEAMVQSAPCGRRRRRSRTGRVTVATTGAAGSPRPVWIPRHRPIAGFEDLLSRIPLRVDDAMLLAVPLSHSWGLAAFQTAVLTRARMVFTDDFDPEDCLWLVASYRIDVLVLAPSMLRQLLELPIQVLTRYDVSCLRVVACCGGPLPSALVLRFLDVFGDILYNVYGTAESSWISIAGPRDLRVSPGTVGRPPTGTEVAIIGPDARPVPVGAVGRIMVRNRMMLDGYDESARHLLDTGDVGYVDVAGRLFVAGPAADSVVTSGKRVLIRPVEEVLESLPQIDAAAVLGVPDRDRGQRLVAFVVRAPDSAPDAESVRDYVRARLGSLSVPQDVHFRDTLPRSEIGTVLKHLLVDSDGAVSRQDDPVPQWSR
ncbi:AMP-binding protein [Nocardia bovistercoris]|uniref:AMP-binding protein n=1 Tax=Nocardia bovistercoris TaxID=2785916 RepID=A0A931IGC7_9NOCA|nr:AMP-binding protein [Nocardia bovistercoris]MBH0779896.1 AMP-binding protein [Nocardia bovistercoris]